MAPYYKYKHEAEVFEARLARVAECDIAWFSGWLCADGHIFTGRSTIVSRLKSRSAPSVGFTITDRDPLYRFAELFGGKVNGSFKRSKSCKLIYRWHLGGAKAVPLLKRCLPWLSIRYRDSALLAMQYKHKPPSKLTPETIRAIKSALNSGTWGIGRRLARQYNVSVSLISNIKKNREYPYAGARMEMFKVPGYWDNPNNFHPDELVNSK